MNSEKFRNKYRIKSHRMPGWDYAGNGIYFITMVTQHRICHLGNINNGKMILSDFGKIAEQQWHESFKMRNELVLHEFMIMPNHLHALIELKKFGGARGGNDGDDLNAGDDSRDGDNSFDGHVETHGRASLQSPPNQSPPNQSPPNQSPPNQSPPNQSPPNQSKNQSNPPINQSANKIVFQRKPKSISSFIAGYKSVVTTKIDDFIDENNLNIPKYNRHNKFWQPNYHDHIVRNEREYWRIKNYIKKNPGKWQEDTFFN